jgi:redox-sensing transcriptional repressor
VIDRLVKCGVNAILNYAPVAAHVPRGVQIKRIDPVLSLQGMTYYLKARAGTAK